MGKKKSSTQPLHSEDGEVVKREAGSGTVSSSGAGAPTNAQVKSGGDEGDDLVDEQSKESFPASDAPAQY